MFLWIEQGAFALDEAAQPGAVESERTAANSEPNSGTGVTHSKKRKGRVPREKEAEGTKAPNRFDTDIVIKSKYELHGQSLEVDTD